MLVHDCSVSRDPFFEAIERALSVPLDPRAFEACAADLLRRDWPRLVPVPGGSDGGMDGAAGTEDGPALPLVTTTARPKDIAGNLERNLRQYLSHGGLARRALLVSSQVVGGARRRRLERLAASLGFALSQIYDRSALAPLLYRSPHWTKDLLGLTGSASALSRVATTSRPLIGRFAIGREDDIRWLREGRQDRVLVGQPGSGKTFLLQLLANEGGGLFMSSTDRNQLADAIREQEPATVFVDDAHGDPSRLRVLAQLRAEVAASFAIVATTWPSGRALVEEHLGTAPSASRELRRLNRDRIVEVVASAGVTGPNNLVRELVDQAEGRPGLAVTLAHMCLVGTGEDVVTGSVLKRSVSTQFSEPLAADILATIALSADEGAELNDIANALEMPLASVRSTALTLAAGGVLYERPDKRLTVRPARLRHGLIKDVFYGPLRYPIEKAVSALRPSASALASSLLGAFYVGAQIDTDALRRHLIEANDGSLWRDYAWHGPEEASWCVRHVPEHRDRYVEATLEHIPSEVLPRLLSDAVGCSDASAHPNLKTIKRWVESALPGTRAAVRNRQALCVASIALLEAPGASSIALEAMRLSLHPGFEAHETDPGRGRTLKLRFGMLPEFQLRDIAELWRTLRTALVGRPQLKWTPILSAAEDWAYPGRHAKRGVEESVHRFCVNAASRMLQDLCDLSQGRPGVARVVSRIASSAELDIQVPSHPMFETLYPLERFEHGALSEQLQKVKTLAHTMCEEKPSAAIAAVAYCEREAADVGLSYPRLTPDLCRFIADSTPRHDVWTHEAQAIGIPDDCVEPFVAGLVRQRPAGWLEQISECLEDSRYTARTSAILMQAPDIPTPFLSRAARTVWNRMWLYNSAARGTLSAEAIELLLSDDRDEVAGMTAVGLWNSGDVTQLQRPTVVNALLRCSPEEHELGEILKGDSALAYSYVVAQLGGPASLWTVPVALEAALQCLSDSQRSALVGLLDNERHCEELVQALVGESTEAFRGLLSRQDLKSLRFAPLYVEEPTSTWLGLVDCALSAGYSTLEVLSRLSMMPRSWWGPESEMWNQRVEQLEAIRRDAPERLSGVLDGLIGACRASGSRASAQEQREEIYGD